MKKNIFISSLFVFCCLWQLNASSMFSGEKLEKINRVEKSNFQPNLSLDKAPTTTFSLTSLKAMDAKTSQLRAKAGQGRTIRCLVLSTTEHFDRLHPKALREIMEEFGGVEYTYTMDLKTLTTEKLLNYDVVWIYNFTNWDRETVNVTGTQISNLLAAYIKGGGYLLECMNLQDMNTTTKLGLLGGAYITEEMSPFKPVAQVVSGFTNMGEVSHPEHPIMDKVKAVNVVAATYLVEAREDALTLAYFEETKAPIVSVYKNIVAVNMQPISLNLIAGVGSYIYGDGHRLLHNSIKWLFSNKYDITAPDAVIDLMATPIASGSQFNIKLDWTNPSYCIDGNALTQLSSIQIYRDNSLLKTIPNPSIGALLSWTDENVPKGSHTYKILATTNTKIGYPSSVNSFSGKDIPAAVKSIVLVPKGNDGYLTWENALYGEHLGLVDTASLRFKIVRQPGNNTVAAAHKGNSFIDNTITVKQRYYYEITPSTEDGQGAKAKSNPIYLYTNGDIYMGTGKIVTCSGKFYGPEGPNATYKDNEAYLFTIAPENPETGRRIQVDFKKMDININVGSADELYVFDGPNMEAKQIKGSPFAGQNIPSILRKLQASTENTSGALSFAFISDPANGGTAWEADISCVQLAPNDMAGLTLKGEVLPLLGTAYPYEVVVKNEGLETQTNFKVNLFAGTANNIVKSTSINRSLASGDTMHLTFTWTPQTVGSTPLGVSVELAGDGNTQNDKSKPYIVNVQSQSTVTTEIKNLADLTTMFVPVCFFYPHSVTQSIYKASEINLAKGKITALRYYNSFQNEISNEHIIIHVVETNNSDLAGGWIPVAQMKKVYDGIFTFPSGKNEITIALDSTFDYKGGNLIVRFEHPMSQYNYTIADAFSILYDLKNDYRTLHYGSFTDVFNEKNSEIKAQSFYPSILFAMDVKGSAAIKGTISCKGLPVDSVVVKIKGTSFVAVTNPKGEYAFPSLNPATYILECSKYSYVTKEVANVVASNGNTSIQDIIINETPRAIISGKVVDAEGLAIEGATIDLTGYDTYHSSTLEDGTFSIEKVYTDKKYELTIRKDRFTTYVSDLSFNANDTILPTIKLMQIPYSTVYVNAQMQENKSVELSWKETADMNFTRLIYDNGIASTAYGTRPEKEGWFGSMFAVSDSGILESVDIFGAKHAALEAGDLGKRKVTVDIFDAHRKIVATSEAFYLPSENWINIPLDYFPYKGTFYVMVHFPVTEAENYNNLVGGDIKGPNANNQTNYYSANGVWGVVQTISNVVPFCFLIRANVFTQGEKVQLHPGAEPSTYIPEMKLTTTEQQDLLENVFDRAYTPSSKIASDFIMSAPSKVAAPKYAIYRFSETQKEQMDAWTLLNQTAISDKSYIDNTFTSLPQGSYYYAIRSIYGENLTSEPAYSQIIHKDMMTTLTIEGSTNIQNGKIEGAQVNLTNFDNNPAHVYTGILDANGKLSISQIWKGKYKIHLSKLGYETLDTTGLFTTESNYTMEVVLKQDKKKPYALQVTPDDLQANTYKFTWNDKKDIVEGFESHSDFTINSGGKLGWSYIDADNLKTYGIQGVSFKNQGQEMAYIIFNPSQTNPPLTNEVAFPYRGKKFLAGFSTSLGQNDDWLLSPELHYTNEFTFSFFAKTFSAVKGLEQIQVGYSVNGKDPSDFVWIQEGNALFVPTTWSEYSYTIPGNVKYVAIRYISNDMFMLMIDEIFIGNEKPGESPIKGFKVYLDGTEVAQTQTNEYVFTNITNPENHKAGVVALYESGESKMSEIGFIPVGIEKNDFADQINIYPNPAQNYIFLEGLNQNATYEIYNIYGSMIKTNRTTKDREQISIADLSSGSYVIRIISNKNIAVKRFIKK